MRNEMNERVKKQFLMASLVSTTELFDMDFSLLRDFQQHLETLRTDQQRRQITSTRLIRHKRTIFILNIFSDNKYTHGESRLLDPTGDIRRKMNICSEHTDMSGKDVDLYLEKMRREFYFMYPAHFKPSLVMYSYYVPCTCAEHNCALAVSEFSKQAKENVYVGYSDVFRATDEDLSVKLLKSAGVQVIRADEIRMNAHKEDLRLETFPLLENQRLTSMRQQACSTMDELFFVKQIKLNGVPVIQPSNVYWSDVGLYTREGNFFQEAFPAFEGGCPARRKHVKAVSAMRSHSKKDNSDKVPVTLISPILLSQKKIIKRLKRKQSKHQQAATAIRGHSNKDNNDKLSVKFISSIRLREPKIIKRLKRKQRKKRSKRLMTHMNIV
ncbi:hypothetical protein DPMN_103159 [Dreissena polymorpha]|uniref:Uncharacterized protein n=1 Tax=Dreissena polymorpha TaxID=45954 RepID=A0A9D4H7D8_DREPO|nr:hypothetical protein DPMN_103159 [Dreissena polymorpha]